MATMPTADEIAARYGIDPTDPAYLTMYAAAVEAQTAYCTVDPYTDSLGEALGRRVANLWFSRSATLGVLDTGTDYGAQYVPRYDPMVNALEAPYRRIPVA